MRSSKRLLIFGLLIASLALLLAATQTWVAFDLAEGAAAVERLDIAGQDVGIGAMPVAMALIAVSVVLAIAGRFARVALAVLAALLGGWIAFASWRFVGGSREAVVAAGSTPLAEATGLGGAEQAAAVSSVEATPWPAVSLAAGVVILLLALAVIVLGRRWGEAGRRYGVSSRRERARPAEGDRIAEWDALSEGDDPTAGG